MTRIPSSRNRSALLLLGAIMTATATGGCTSTLSKGAQLEMKVTYLGALSGTYVLYVTATNSSATPASGWSARGLYAKSQFAVQLSYATGLKNTGTSYAHAYWSKSGADSGPQAGDPYGNGAFKKRSFSDSVSVDVSLK